MARTPKSEPANETGGHPIAQAPKLFILNALAWNCCLADLLRHPPGCSHGTSDTGILPDRLDFRLVSS